MIQNTRNTSDSLAASEALSARGVVAPRVSLADIENNIQSIHYLNAGEAVLPESSTAHSLDLLTLCFVTTRNGFVIVGKSAPASPENFDKAKGETFAYEDAIRQLWPLMGYALRETLIAQPCEESLRKAEEHRLKEANENPPLPFDEEVRATD
jgi:hypothetical protein